MQTLAGLKRIKYILVYPETGDIVLAGPAGDWRRDVEGRFVDDKRCAGPESRRPRRHAAELPDRPRPFSAARSIRDRTISRQPKP